MKELTEILDPGKLLENTAKTALGFIEKMIGPACEEFGLAISDNVKYWRFKNKIDITLKAKKFLESKGIEPKQVEPKIVIPLLESGSMENNDDLQTMWAALLANAADPTSAKKITPSFIEILKQLSSAEVKLLNQMHVLVSKKSNVEKLKMTFDKKKIMQFLSATSEQFDFMTSNLYRLGICQPPSSGGAKIGPFPIAVMTYELFSFTPFGYDFINACKFDTN